MIYELSKDRAEMPRFWTICIKQKPGVRQYKFNYRTRKYILNANGNKVFNLEYNIYTHLVYINTETKELKFASSGAICKTEQEAKDLCAILNTWNVGTFYVCETGQS